MFARSPSAGPRRLKRAIAALTALFLLGSTTESVWADGHCAHHAALPGDFSTPPASASPGQPDAHGAAGFDAANAAHEAQHAGNGAAHAAIRDAHDDSGAKHDQDAHGCTCLGDCTVNVSVIVTPAASASTIPFVYHHVPTAEPLPLLATSAVLELLPFAQAPPVR